MRERKLNEKEISEQFTLSVRQLDLNRFSSEFQFSKKKKYIVKTRN